MKTDILAIPIRYYLRMAGRSISLGIPLQCQIEVFGELTEYHINLLQRNETDAILIENALEIFRRVVMKRANLELIVKEITKFDLGCEIFISKTLSYFDHFPTFDDEKEIDGLKRKYGASRKYVLGIIPLRLANDGVIYGSLFYHPDRDRVSIFGDFSGLDCFKLLGSRIFNVHAHSEIDPGSNDWFAAVWYLHRMVSKEMKIGSEMGFLRYGWGLIHLPLGPNKVVIADQIPRELVSFFNIHFPCIWSSNRVRHRIPVKKVKTIEECLDNTLAGRTLPESNFSIQSVINLGGSRKTK